MNPMSVAAGAIGSRHISFTIVHATPPLLSVELREVESGLVHERLELDLKAGPATLEALMSARGMMADGRPAVVEITPRGGDRLSLLVRTVAGHGIALAIGHRDEEDRFTVAGGASPQALLINTAELPAFARLWAQALQQVAATADVGLATAPMAGSI